MKESNNNTEWSQEKARIISDRYQGGRFNDAQGQMKKDIAAALVEATANEREQLTAATELLKECQKELCGDYTPQLSDKIDAFLADSPQPDSGTSIAESLRAECNNLTTEERREMMGNTQTAQQATEHLKRINRIGTPAPVDPPQAAQPETHGDPHRHSFESAVACSICGKDVFDLLTERESTIMTQSAVLRECVEAMEPLIITYRLPDQSFASVESACRRASEVVAKAKEALK